MAISDRSLLFRWPGMLLAAIASGVCLLGVGHTLLQMAGGGHPTAVNAAQRIADFRRSEARDSRAAELGIEAVLEMDPATGKISARVFFEPELLPDHLELSLRRADGMPPPRLLQLQRLNAETYLASLPPLTDGTWLAELRAPDWRLKAELEVPRFAMVHISPTPSGR